MPFESGSYLPPRVAIVGGGISGLAAAWLLKDTARVTLYEAESGFGGHARTVIAGRRGDQPVDTGFIVFNRVNYPRLCGLFEELDVPVIESDMSFGASFGNGSFEYGLRNLLAVFGQTRNAVRPAFLRMLRDIMRFNSGAKQAVRPGESIGDLMARMGLGPWFRDRYLTPLSGAIWSTPSRDILDFPAEAFVRFFDNHALLHHTGQHQWLTVRGGSVEYVRRLVAALKRAGVDLRPGARVRSIARMGDAVELTAEGETEIYDQVVLALHSDDALSVLRDPDQAERDALGAIRYQPNRAILHCDSEQMPRRRSVWSSWNYLEPSPDASRIALTYWMNRLQPIPLDDPMFVTLNPARRIPDASIYDEVAFRHPVYDRPAEAARSALKQRQGRRRTWFCGAWMHDGFHEDGVQSAADVAQGMAARFAAQSDAAK